MTYTESTKGLPMTFLPLAQVLTPQSSFVDVLIDHYWLVDQDGNVGVWEGRAPQANPDRRIAERFRNRYPWAVAVVRIPRAFVSHKCD